MLAALEETLEETRRTNKLLQDRVEQLEEELRNARRGQGGNDDDASVCSQRKKMDKIYNYIL